jgi:hypothetical protein
MSKWSDEETDEPLIADNRNFYKVEKWTKDGSKVDHMLYRPRIRLTIRQRSLVLEQWPKAAT